ncbi:ABC-type phosphate transport system, periplasmic component [Oleiphilus messinensis]|uniref:ABC-type phosphate transport system, periplasmic component n=1 Tax=Oleiphilus messinensis TaxID=141451 RepID=A0A1Y0IFW8_9GAMM|nr:phosphate ABC transporter substrate-binding protein [Oleiphilus messinensis]ARU59412.1 ABC-type phosphate transport system, periplasmic component [Oleiphilus messinensis]
MKLSSISRRIFSHFTAILVLCFSGASFADVAIVINPGKDVTLNEKDISRIFLAKVKTFPDGTEIVPVDLPLTSAQRQLINSNLINKTESQVRAYWSKLVFTGKGLPPKELESQEAVKQMIASNANVIGYIDAALVDDTVKVVTIIK